MNIMLMQVSSNATKEMQLVKANDELSTAKAEAKAETNQDGSKALARVSSQNGSSTAAAAASSSSNSRESKSQAEALVTANNGNAMAAAQSGSSLKECNPVGAEKNSQSTSFASAVTALDNAAASEPVSPFSPVKAGTPAEPKPATTGQSNQRPVNNNTIQAQPDIKQTSSPINKNTMQAQPLKQSFQGGQPAINNAKLANQKQNPMQQLMQLLMILIAMLQKLAGQKTQNPTPNKANTPQSFPAFPNPMQASQGQQQPLTTGNQQPQAIPNNPALQSRPFEVNMAPVNTPQANTPVQPKPIFAGAFVSSEMNPQATPNNNNTQNNTPLYSTNNSFQTSAIAMATGNNAIAGASASNNSASAGAIATSNSMYPQQNNSNIESRGEALTSGAAAVATNGNAAAASFSSTAVNSNQSSQHTPASNSQQSLKALGSAAAQAENSSAAASSLSQTNKTESGTAAAAKASKEGASAAAVAGSNTTTNNDDIKSVDNKTTSATSTTAAASEKVEDTSASAASASSASSAIENKNVPTLVDNNSEATAASTATASAEKTVSIGGSGTGTPMSELPENELKAVEGKDLQAKGKYNDHQYLVYNDHLYQEKGKNLYSSVVKLPYGQNNLYLSKNAKIEEGGSGGYDITASANAAGAGAASSTPDSSTASSAAAANVDIDVKEKPETINTVTSKERTASPLIVDANNDGKISATQGKGVDLDGDNKADGAATDGDKMLTLGDLNKDGKIDGSEVFGDRTVDPYTGEALNAKNGFEALEKVALSVQSKHPEVQLIDQDGNVDIETMQKLLKTDGIDLGFVSGENNQLDEMTNIKSVNIKNYADHTETENGKLVQHNQQGSYTDQNGLTRKVDDVWFALAS